MWIFILQHFSGSEQAMQALSLEIMEKDPESEILVADQRASERWLPFLAFLQIAGKFGIRLCFLGNLHLGLKHAFGGPCAVG